MSQHDFNIANQGFASFRQDLNNSLVALANNSAGATEPPTTYAYQFWYDETADLLKMRNSDDDAWITLAAFDQATDEWEIRSAVIQAVDSAGVSIKTDDGTTRVTIADDGNVGIGVSNPLAKIHTNTATGSAKTNTLLLQGGYSAGNSSHGIGFTINTTLASAGVYAGDSGTGSALIFTTSEDYDGSPPSNTERMRIDSSGNVLVGRSSVGSDLTQDGFTVYRNASGGGTTAYAVNGGSGTAFAVGTQADANLVIFARSGTQVGSISVTTSATAYNTSSDYRLKEDVQPMLGASDRLMALKPVNFAWKVDGSRTDGFLAHEAQEVVPEAVTGEKDAVDDEGNPVYQGIDQSKLVPLLTAALQEAITKIEQLETRLAKIEKSD